MSSTEDLLSADYRSPEVVSCPYPFYSALVERAPVHKVPGRNEYLISGHAEVAYAARHPELFSSLRPWLKPTHEKAAEAAARGYERPPTVVDNDDPDHAGYRSAMFRPITPARLRDYEPLIQGIVDSLIDSFAARGEADFVSEFAELLPRRVIMALLDLPAEDRPQLKRWADEWNELLTRRCTPKREVELWDSAAQFEAHLAKLIDERRLRPGNDVVSELIASTAAGPPIDTPHLIGILKQYLLAGALTTTMMLSHSLLFLLSDEELMGRVRADHDLIPKLLEESLRLESPSQYGQRICARDIELGGVPIPAGAIVLLVWGASNRDPAEFPEPAAFDLERPNGRTHFAFGYGVHSCLGAPLARIEGRISFETLLSRFDPIWLTTSASDLSHDPNPKNRGLTELRIAFKRSRS